MLPLFALTTALISDSPSQPPSAQSFYATALRAMSDVKEPPYASYTLVGAGQGLAVHLMAQHHLVWLSMTADSDTTRWNVRHRTNDYQSEIFDEKDKRWVSQRSFFDPTWYGSYRALRDGMLGYQDVEKAVVARATPDPAVLKLPVIAVTSVMGVGTYRVVDKGGALCPSGAPGHALHLIARDHSPEHQLSDVVVELASMRLCMIRYGESSGFGFQGYVEQHYADVGGYWMQTSGVIDGTLRVFGISLHHGRWNYQLTKMAFPASIPSASFVVPTTQ